MRPRLTYEPGWSGGDAHRVYGSEPSKPGPITAVVREDDAPLLWIVEDGVVLPCFRDRRAGYTR